MPLPPQSLSTDPIRYVFGPLPREHFGLSRSRLDYATGQCGARSGRAGDSATASGAGLASAAVAFGWRYWDWVKEKVEPRAHQTRKRKPPLLDKYS